MNVLFIVTELNSANGICTQSVMSELLSQGHSVYCITNDEHHANLLPDVKYLYVKPRLVYRLLSDTKKIKRVTGAVLNKLKLLISYPTWPLISLSYTERIYKAADSICESGKIDTVIPIYTQIDTVIAAKRIKEKYPDIRFIPYFLDSLSGGYGPKYFSKGWVIRRGLKWEKKLLKAADRVIMMQSSFKHCFTHCQNTGYYKKTVFLDLPLLIKPQEQRSTEDTEGDGLIHMVYVGTLPLHIRNPEIFLKIFLKTTDKRLRLHIIGADATLAPLSTYALQDDRIIAEDRIPHSEAVLRIASADITVNFGNNNSSMTPSKIFEYMSHGKPIISTMPIKDEPSAVYLKKYPLAHLIDYSDTDLDAAAEKMQSWINEVLGKTAPFSDTEAIFKSNTPKAFSDVITEHLN